MLPGSRVRPSQAGEQQSQQSIQPRPLTQYDFANSRPSLNTGLEPLNTAVFVRGPSYPQDHSYSQQPQPSPHTQLPAPDSASSYYAGQVPSTQGNYPGQFAAETAGSYQSHQYPQGGQFHPISVSYDTPIDQKPVVSEPSFPPNFQEQYYQHQQHRRSTQEEGSYNISPQSPHGSQQYHQYEQRPHLVQMSDRHASDPFSQIRSLDMGHGAYPPSSGDRSSSFHIPQNTLVPQQDVHHDVNYVAQHTVLEQPVALNHTQRNFKAHLLNSGFAADHVSPTQVLDEAAVENEDDDYYDVASDEEMEDEPAHNIISNRDFSMILRLHAESIGELSIRSYDAFLFKGMLDQYRAERVANPLKNPQTARVFAHFIYATGPSLSIFERNPRSPSAIFEGHTPPALQSLWTYYLPMKALNHQGLLHAMLALASLHIAKLQGASSTPSYKHYAYALKRLGRYLGNQKMRHSIATLATSLLLAFYEVMTAEHVKWSTHLVGGRLLITELDYRTMSQEARKLKARQAAFEKNAFPYQHPEMLIDQRQLNKNLQEDTLMPDENLVGMIFGQQIRYDDSGRAYDFEYSGAIPQSPDLKTYEVFQDLYWWYCRHDAFQSVISGNPLIMDYRRWSDCPPRAPFARLDALYGSHDHIMLLLARISDFTARDRERKLKQVQANGGRWRPMPGMPMGPPPPQGGQAGPGPSPTTPMGPPSNAQGMEGPPGRTGTPASGFNMEAPKMSSTGQYPISPMGRPPGYPSQTSPTGGPPPSAGPPQGQPQGPMFYGMAPASPQAPLPASYAFPHEPSFNQYHNFHPQAPQSAHPQTAQTPHASDRFPDLAAAYTTALREWSSINSALQTLLSILRQTAEFAPLGPEFAQVKPTPFGPSLQYRRHDIGIIWSQLYLANIVLIRSHPGMPPAAMQAAGIAAPQTGQMANECGRIAAGMEMPGSGTSFPEAPGPGPGRRQEAPLNPSLGAALVESTMPLFFAGIQYRDPLQREWTVTRLLDIDRRTGWGSAGIIARGCETAWETAGRMGKAPMYENRRTKRPGTAGAKENEGPKMERVIEITDEQERRFLLRDGSGRLPWSMGLLATEEDLRIQAEKRGQEKL